MKALAWNEVASRTSPSQKAGPSRLHAVATPPTWLVRFEVVVSLIAAAAAGLLGFAILGNATLDVGPGRIHVAARPAFPGTTTLSFPPFGSVSAETHDSPLAVSAALEEVDLPQLQRMALDGMPGTRTIDAYRGEAARGAQRAVGKGLIAALIGGAFVGWAVRRSWRTTLAGGVLGLAVPTLLVAWAVTGFQAQAFGSPRYTGAMRYAPSLIGLVQGRIEKVGDLQRQIDDAVRQLNAYYSQPQTFSSGGDLPNTYRVLQVSDLHLDPVGFKLEQELADQFHASLILDLGDAENYGTAIEASMLQRFLPKRTPRLFVPGNHDSPGSIRALKSLHGVTVVESSGTVTIDGLRIFGLADPMSRVEDWEPDKPRVTAEAREAAGRLAAEIASGAPKPHIIATHNPLGLQPFAGMAPLLAAGHTHTADMARMGSSWYVNSGTVGGVDFAKLYSDPSIAHGASIFYFTKTLPRRLVAIDNISIEGKADQSSLKRTIVDPRLLEEIKSAAATSTPEARGAAAGRRVAPPSPRPSEN